MTTGRINQVAFLTDAGVARGRRARRARATSRGDDRQSFGAGDGRRLRAKRRPCVRPLPSGCSASESSGRSSRAETLRMACGSERKLAFAVHPAPHTPEGQQRRENVQRCDVRIPSDRYATQETRVRPRLTLLRRPMKGNAREDVAAPAGIQPTQASPSLLTRRHDPHPPSQQAARRQPQRVTGASSLARVVQRKARSSYYRFQRFFFFKTNGRRAKSPTHRHRLEHLALTGQASQASFPYRYETQKIGTGRESAAYIS